ncbi:hypothetical protein HDR67_03330 [bacterium]|nr:hypothetical protein [bacterium]
MTANFVDTDEYDLYNGNVKSYVTLSSTGEGAKEITRKDVSITKPTQPEKNLSSSKMDFTGLTADTKYSLKLVLSANGSQKTLATKEATTLNNGESENDPILIDNLDKLLGMNKTKDAYYKLTADIDCGGSLASIFNSGNIFTGHFDGDNHKIYNFKMDSNQYTGLFGYVSGATIQNLVLEGVSYDSTRSNTYLGALAGHVKHSTISNITIKDVTISHSGQTTTFGYIGGCVGLAENSVITNCSVTDLSIVTPYARLKMYVGGFVGENKNSKISDCYVSGKIENTISYTSNKDGCLYVGGFSGINDSARGILNCYSLVDITVTEPETVTNVGKETFKLYVGGFNGGNNKDASKFENCASIGDITVQAKHAYFVYVGGFAAYTDDMNISKLDQCVYSPKEKGITATFVAPPAETENDEADNDSEETEKKVEQIVYISLGVGKIGDMNADKIHTLVYKELIEITNEHENVTKTPYVVGQDLSSFSETIRKLFSSLEA